MSAICSLPLRSIDRDDGIHPRVAGIVESHVAALMKTPDVWPALAVVEDGGHYVLVDGFHRYVAAERLGMEAVVVQIMAMPADRNLRGLAFDLNLRREEREDRLISRLLRITIDDESLCAATRIAAARAGISGHAYIIRLLMADERVRVSLACVDMVDREGRPE
jgi:hypothetical protein